jgi:hypothetical protein
MRIDLKDIIKKSDLKELKNIRNDNKLKSMIK